MHNKWLALYRQLQPMKAGGLTVGCSIRWRGIDGLERGQAIVEEVITLPTLQHSNIGTTSTEGVDIWALISFDNVGRWISTKIITDVQERDRRPLDPRKGPHDG
jgi:hypothetical protein